MNRTVILACSKRKRTDTAELSALARYDGPAWRTLRANMTCLIEPPFALSAAHGLISAYQKIPDYDLRLDRERVDQLVDTVAEQLDRLGREGKLAGDIFAYGGELYRELLKRAEQRASRSLHITYASGGIGDQLGQLKAFLIRDAVPMRAINDEGDE